MNLIQTNTLNSQATIKDALRILDRIGVHGNTLFVVDDFNKLLGTVTDGDIRRALLKDYKLDDSVINCVNRNFRKIIKNGDYSHYIKKYKQEGFRFIPLVSSEEDLLSIMDLQQYSGFLPVDAVIMAGGKGQRLLPLTAKLPKPMLKVGNKPIIEHNIDRLIKFGVQNIYISVNYLKTSISNYFLDGANKGIKISYIEEMEALGTFGAVTLIDDYSKDFILVMNSDLLTDINFDDFFNSFLESEADMAVATVPYYADIPYAVLEITNGNQVLSLKEKPRYTYFSNAGIYIIKKDLLRYIPKGKFYNTTDLMELLIAKNMKLITYPILGYWLDIGRMNDYLKAQEDIKHLHI